MPVEPGTACSPDTGSAPLVAAPPPDHLAGAVVAPDPSLRLLDGGRTLLGGSPLRLVRLSPTGANVVRRLIEGTPVPPGTAPTSLVRRLLDGGLVHPRHQAGPWTARDVTVVVPVLGALPVELLDRLAGPAAEALPTRPARIVVVDDASPIPVTLPPDVELDPGVEVHIVRRLTNGGPGAARNTGLDHVTTALVAFVDADCRPTDGWLEALLAHFADPLVAAVAPRIVAAQPVEPAGPAEPAGPRGTLARYEAARSALDMGPDEGRVRARTRVSFVPSAALVARTDVVRAAGGFDAAMRVGEDVDLVWRLDEAGAVVRYEPRSHVGHVHRTTPGAWARRRVDYGRSAGPLAVRHPGALVPLEASGWSVAAWGLAVAGHPVVGLGVAAATTALLARRLGELDRPLRVAARLAGAGHLGAGRLLATALVRPWWPLTVAAAVVGPRRVRQVALAAVVVPAALEWRTHRPPLDPLRWTALRLADDAAYATGVWLGAWQSRTGEPLRPDLTNWPRPGAYTRWRTSPTGRTSRTSRGAHPGPGGDPGPDPSTRPPPER